jgi:hypothetical protein
MVDVILPVATHRPTLDLDEQAILTLINKGHHRPQPLGKKLSAQARRSVTENDNVNKAAMIKVKGQAL